MDDMSVNLKECPTRCRPIAGGAIVNHLMYADDIVLLSQSATGLSLLLEVENIDWSMISDLILRRVL